MKLKAKTKNWNNDVEKHFEKQKITENESQVAEYSIQRNYLDLVLELPWNEFS